MAEYETQHATRNRQDVCVYDYVCVCACVYVSVCARVHTNMNRTILYFCANTRDVAGVSPGPIQMLQGWAQSRCRCERDAPSPRTDVA